MKKTYTLITGSALLISSLTQLNAQCTGGRYHNYIFPGAPVVTSNVTYGSNTKSNGSTQILKLDIYEPLGDVATNRACIVFAHGGGFTQGSKTDASYVQFCTQLTKLGYVVANIEYRLGFPQDQYGFNSAIMRGVHDARAAIRFMRDKALNHGNPYKINPNMIFFSGVSAGAIMALHLAYQDQASECNMACGGQPGAEANSVQGSSNNLTCASTVKAIVAVSGGIRDLSWIHNNDVPACLAHGDNDNVVPYGHGSFGGYFAVDGSSKVAGKCNSTSTEYCFKRMYGQGHVPSNPAYLDTLASISRNFLEHFTCGTAQNCSFTGVPVIVQPSVASAVITAGTNPICAGQSVTFTATPTNGGTTPVYQWKVNGVNAGTNSPTFTTTSLTTGQIVTCVLTSNLPGVTGSPATSSGITMTVNALPAVPTITQLGLVLTSSSLTGNQWYMGGIIIPAATSPVYTVLLPAIFTLKVTVNGCTSPSSLPVNVSTLGIEKQGDTDFFNVYPNPSEGICTVSFNAATADSYRLVFTNALGQMVYQESLKNFGGEYSKQIDVSQFGKGIYLINLSSSDTQIVKKVFVN